LAAANALGLAGELCLVLALCGSTEHNLFGRRVNITRMWPTSSVSGSATTS
jgi:hypothetical protein